MRHVTELLVYTALLLFRPRAPRRCCLVLGEGFKLVWVSLTPRPARHRLVARSSAHVIIFL